MVGNEHVDAAGVRGGNALDAADPVVDGDDDSWRALCGERDDLRCKPVAELEPVRNEIVDLRPQCRESAYTGRTRRGAVGVVIGNDEEAFSAFDRIGEPRRRRLDALERLPRREQ
jgi:hypothetical protein